jgi:hypothetical protein
VSIDVTCEMLRGTTLEADMEKKNAMTVHMKLVKKNSTHNFF